MSKGSTLWLFAVALLTACHGDAVQAPVASVAPQTSAPAAVKRGPTPAELTAGMVEAATLGKSSVPVGVKFDLGGRPVVGQPLEVVFAVMPQVVASSGSLKVTGGEGLQIGPDAGPVEIPSLDPTEVYRVSVTITPTADGVQLLGLNVTLKHDEATEMRSFAVPIIVGTSADAATATASTGKH
jgi:hypothetical protein